MAYDLEVSSPTATVYTRTVGESPDLGAHLVDLELDYDIVYSWRARARVGDLFGPWSSWASFLSPTRPVATAPSRRRRRPAPVAAPRRSRRLVPVKPASPGRTIRRSSARLPASSRAALRNSCQDHGGSWEFMDRAIDALRAKDGRYGYNAKRGNMNDPSVDVASYFYANGDNIQNRHEVYIFDLIAGHCGATPSTAWVDVTDITNSSGTIGRTMYPRPGRDVGACAAASAGQ